MPIKAYHDVPNCGYRVFIDNKKVMYITDTYTLEGITAKDYDLYLIEANYENVEELHNRAINDYYERRVKHTHLSKEQCNNFFIKNAKDSSVLVYMHEHKEKK